MNNNINENNEIWKDIINYEEIYQVSNLGRVRSLDRINHYNRKIKGKIINPYKHREYKRVTFYKIRIRHDFLVHRLVAKHFILNPENKPYINHIDGIPYNNNVNNLEFCTQLENVRHAYKIGLTNNLGENNWNSKLTLKDVKTILKLSITEKKTILEISKIFAQFNYKTLEGIINRRRWKWVIL